MARRAIRSGSAARRVARGGQVTCARRVACSSVDFFFFDAFFFCAVTSQHARNLRRVQRMGPERGADNRMQCLFWRGGGGFAVRLYGCSRPRLEFHAVVEADLRRTARGVQLRQPRCALRLRARYCLTVGFSARWTPLQRSAIWLHTAMRLQRLFTCTAHPSRRFNFMFM